MVDVNEDVLMNIGEKIETLVLCRCDGVFGKYLGSTAVTFGACQIDDIVYKVERNIELDGSPMWVVRNVNDGTVATHDDSYGLSLIKERDFVKPELIHAHAN